MSSSNFLSELRIFCSCNLSCLSLAACSPGIICFIFPPLLIILSNWVFTLSSFITSGRDNSNCFNWLNLSWALCKDSLPAAIIGLEAISFIVSVDIPALAFLFTISSTDEDSTSSATLSPPLK